MPIEIEFASVVVRKEAFDALGPAADEVVRKVPNWLEDDHLVRVGFMSTREALDLVDRLTALGLGPDDVALLQQSDGAPAWLEVGEVGGRWCVWARGVSASAGDVVHFGDDEFALKLASDPLAVLRAFGATLTASGSSLRCSRDGAEFELHAFANEALRANVVLARRDPTRRSTLKADRSFLRECEAELLRAGASPLR